MKKLLAIVVLGLLFCSNGFTGDIVIFVIMYFIYWKTNKATISGYMLGLFFVLLWSLRFVIEFFKVAQVEGREDWILGMNTGQALSVPFIILGIYLMFRKK